MDAYVTREMNAAREGLAMAGQFKAFLKNTKDHRDTALGEFVRWIDLEERKLLKDELERWKT